MEFGYERASLRVIARRAGVTTGAIYGYYPDKAALFDAIVTEPAEALYEKFLSAVNRFESLSLEDQYKKVEGVATNEMGMLLDILYKNHDAFLLVLSRSSGTRWESYLDLLIKIEEDSSRDFLIRMKEAGQNIPDISNHMIHMIASAYFNAFAEIILHDMPRDEATEYIGTLNDFFTAGWMKLLNKTS